MSAKAQLLSTMAIVAVVGIAVIVIGVSEGGGLGTWIAVIGVLTVMLAGVGAIETMRWLRPSTRLPEHLRNSVPVAAWRRSPITLQLRDGTRIVCVAIRPGGYVPPRKSDPALRRPRGHGHDPLDRSRLQQRARTPSPARGRITASETEVVAVGSTAVLIVVATFSGSHGLV
jgi:hypothetical protein